MTSSTAAVSHMCFDQSLLKQLVPIRELQPEDRYHLTITSDVIDMNPGDPLIDDTQAWLVYLLAGHIELIDKDGHSLRINAGEPRARHTLFPEKSHCTHATAITHCQVVRFDRRLFSRLLQQETIRGEKPGVIEVNKVERCLFDAIVHAFNHGTLKLPGLPDIAVKVKAASSDPNASINDVARIVEADPAIVARLMQVANSPISRGSVPVKSIRSAIVRLGLAMTRNLVFSLAMNSLFKTGKKILSDRMRELYDYSVEVAAISYAIGKLSGTLEPDQLFLAGLIHDIGVIPILAYADEAEPGVTDPQELARIIDNLRTPVGSLVIQYWDFSPELTSVVEQAHNWQRDSDGDLNPCDVVIIAQIYSRLKQGCAHDLPPLEQVPAFKKLFPEKIDPEFVIRVMDQAQEEIREVTRILKI